jgi:hypothetical protein
MTIADKTISAIEQRPIHFTLYVDKPGLWHKIGILPKKKHFVIKPLTLGTILRISAEVFKIKFDENEKFDQANLVAKTLESALANTECLINVLALAMTGTEKPPSNRLKRFIRENMPTEKMFQLLTAIAALIDVTGFIHSIILVKRMSLINDGELIAPGEQSEA